ncbi:MAG: thioredoxin domain-containing protein [Tetrasphaera sp.]|jgi:protein-disulfide isomerase|nr:thioredoxin domain-containing protein [Tetrasphaera sp.]
MAQNRPDSPRDSRSAKIQAAQKAGPSAGASRMTIAAIVFIVAVIAVVGGVILTQKSSEKKAAAGGNSVPTGASATAGYPGNTGVTLVSGAPTLALYEDFQCPNCALFEKTFGPTIKELAGAGKVKLEYHILNFLDDSGGNQSTTVANGVFCAADAGRFQAFHDAAFVGQFPEGQNVTVDDITKFAETAGLSGDSLSTWKTCVKAGKYTKFITDTNDAAFKISGFRGTPTVILNGKTLELSTPESLAAAVQAATTK